MGTNLFLLLAGIACAGVGGELFVRGSVTLSAWARISPALAGVTVAAFATSSPEFSVGLTSAMAGLPHLALGDALGSNVVNVALILGLALLLGGLPVKAAEIRRDLVAVMAMPILLGLLALDGVLGRVDGLVLIGAFLLWLGLVMGEARAHRRALTVENTQLVPAGGVALAQLAVGLGFLILAGKLIVVGGKAIALHLGMSELAVGLTVISVATGTPELATTLVARWRGHDDLSLGNILGSNLFNGLLIVGMVAFITPITLNRMEILSVLAFGLLSSLMMVPLGSGLRRWRGGVLLGTYATYLALML